jgi:hypothetical protein
MNQKNKNRTAVEKMAEWLEAEIGHYVPHEKRLYIQLIISNAKALEKEQIINARQDGVDVVFKGYSISNEEYYNETYGGDE